MLRSAVLVCLVATLMGCGAEEGALQPSQPSDPGLIHVHGLGRNPADGALMIATHTGLFRAAAGGGAPTRVAGNYQFLGLIESRNAGRDWRPISLRGRVDFHVLEA
jgi:hypothetical protein